MSDLAIQIKDLGKMYKLFRNRREKLMETIGAGKFLPWKKKNYKYQEFWALRDINIEVPRGQRLGIIGRNGAGKSTLLKIITGNIAPTEGALAINGQIQALMELGTGFHPEFTGIENIRASLAYLGFDKKKIPAMEKQIIEFAEVEDFIHQPIKTYSAGMYTRLAFSVATSIEPDILIIDEVLGAGDAYFASKCLDRMRRLTDDSGATVLFVSHDLSSVQRFCDRAVWVDRGRVVMEGDTLSVTKAYGASVRQQDEIRLRAKNLGLSRQAVTHMRDTASEPMLFHLINGTWTAFKEKRPIRKISLRINGGTAGTISVGHAMDNDAGHEAHLETGPGYMEWSEPVRIDGGYARMAAGCGGVYAHAPFVLPAPVADGPLRAASVEIEYKDTSGEKIFLELYDAGKYRRVGALENANDGRWKTAVLDVTEMINKRSAGPEAPERSAPGEDGPGEDGMEDAPDSHLRHDIEGDTYGTGEVLITRVRFLDAENMGKYIFTTGEAMKIRVSYKAVKAVSDPVFVAAIYRMDGVVVNQAVSSRDGLDFGRVEGEGSVDLLYDPLYIGAGDYIVSIGIFHHVDLLGRGESPSYCLHDRKYQFKVRHPQECAVDLGLVNHPVAWSRK